MKQNQTIGDRIKQRRESLEMSQDELAKKLGYKSRSSIAKIEKDGRELPQKKIASIAAALKTTPSYIMGWEEKEKANTEIVSIVGRMRTDQEFLEAVSILNMLDAQKFESIKQMLNVLK